MLPLSLDSLTLGWHLCWQKEKSWPGNKGRTREDRVQRKRCRKQIVWGVERQKVVESRRLFWTHISSHVKARIHLLGLLFLTSLLEYNCLQSCISFCCITKWISYMYTYKPISPPSGISLPPSLSHPSRWSQSTELISLCDAAASH